MKTTVHVIVSAMVASTLTYTLASNECPAQDSGRQTIKFVAADDQLYNYPYHRWTERLCASKMDNEVVTCMKRPL